MRLCANGRAKTCSTDEAVPQRIAATRGAAISLAFVSPSKGTMTWLGIGSVEGRVLSGDPSATRPKGSLALGNGVPGHELPA